MPFRTLVAGELASPASSNAESRMSSLSLDGWSPRRDHYIDFYDDVQPTSSLSFITRILTKRPAGRDMSNAPDANKKDASGQGRASLSDDSVAVDYERLESDDETPSLSRFSLTDSIDDTPLLTPQSLTRAQSSETLETDRRQANDEEGDDEATIKLGTSVHTIRAPPAKPWLKQSRSNNEQPAVQPGEQSTQDLVVAAAPIEARYSWVERRGPQGLLGLEYRQLEDDDSGLDSEEESDFVCPFADVHEMHTVQFGRRVRLDIEQLTADGIVVHDCITGIVHRPARRGRDRKRHVRTSPKVKEARTRALAEAMETPMIHGQTEQRLWATETASATFSSRKASFIDSLRKWRSPASEWWWSWLDPESPAFAKRNGTREYTSRHKPAPAMRVSWIGDRPVALVNRPGDLLEPER